MFRLKLMLPLLALLGLGVLAWPRRAGSPDGELVLISPHWEGIQEEFGRAFADHWRAQTGRNVRVVWRDLGGTGKCVRHLRDQAPGESGADVFFGGGVESLIELARDGFLAPVELPAETAAAIPPRLGDYPLRDEKNLWFVACLSTFGICVNRPALAEFGLGEPREWADLAEARFFNKVGSGNPASSGVVRMTYEIILQTYGWEAGWAVLTRMGGNVRSFTEGANGIPRDVALGQFAAGGSIDFYAQEKVYRLGPESIGFLVPREMPVVNGDPVAVLAGAPHAELAAEFVRFVLSAEGQRLWYARIGGEGGPRKFGLGRLPVRPAAYREAPPEIAAGNPFAMAGLGRYDFQKAARRARALEALLGATITEPHAELRRAWKVLIDAGRPAGAEAEFGRPPCSEAEFLAIADRLWNDKSARPSERNAQAAEWGRWARGKYDTIAGKPRP